MLSGSNTSIIFLVVAFIGLMIYFMDLIPESRNAYIFAGMLLGGAAGNLIDRIFLGFVRDFIGFSFWPAFNIADAAVTIGGIGLLFCMSKAKK